MEEQVLAFLAFLVDKIGPIGVVIASGLGSLVVLAQAIVLVTPSPTDNAFMDKVLSVPVLGGVLKALLKFAPIQKK